MATYDNQYGQWMMPGRPETSYSGKWRAGYVPYDTKSQFKVIDTTQKIIMEPEGENILDKIKGSKFLTDLVGGVIRGNPIETLRQKAIGEIAKSTIQGTMRVSAGAVLEAKKLTQ